MSHGWVVFKQNLRTLLIDNLIKLINKSINQHKTIGYYYLVFGKVVVLQ